MPETQIVYQDTGDKPKFNLCTTIGLKETVGDVGIEIEIEGSSLLHDSIPAPWTYHKDHSLRGEENAEYVLKAPVSFSAVPKSLDTLFQKLKANEAKFDDSNRTSVHVHLNCQEFYLNRLTTFLSAWYCVEEILTQFCGEHRVGNLFCLRAVDAPALVNQLRRFIRSDGQVPLGDVLHYGGLNPNALHKYGSIEIRTLRGPKNYEDQKLITDWISILEQIYNMSAKYEDPREFVSMFSGGGPLPFFDIILGDMAPTVMAYVSMHPNEISQAMMRGIRFAQDLCFCRDWDDFKPVRLTDDPFGRSKKTVANKMVNLGPIPMPTAGGEYHTQSNSLAEMHEMYTAAVNALGQHAVGVEAEAEVEAEVEVYAWEILN